MLPLNERQAQRALRKVAGMKGEDISSIIDNRDAEEEKKRNKETREEAEKDEPIITPQFAIGGIRQKEFIPNQNKDIVDPETGNVLVKGEDNDAAAVDKPKPVSEATKKEAASMTKAAAESKGWVSNTAAVGAGGGTSGSSVGTTQTSGIAKS